MIDLLRQNEVLLKWLGGLSVAMFVGSLLIVPLLVARIPSDYFIRPRDNVDSLRHRHPVVVIAGHIAKNLMGVICIAAGIVMLVLPGQGLLTILVGVMLLDFPGKRRLELALIRRPAVLQAVNWLRRQAGHGNLEVR